MFRELGRDPHDLGVVDGPPHLLDPRPRGREDHAARPGPEVPSSTTFGRCSSSTSLPTIPTSAAPCSTKTGTSEGRLTMNSAALPVEEPPAVLPQDLDRHPGRLEGGEGVVEDRTLRHRDPQPPHGSTALATDEIAGSPGGDANELDASGAG